MAYTMTDIHTVVGGGGGGDIYTEETHIWKDIHTGGKIHAKEHKHGRTYTRGEHTDILKRDNSGCVRAMVSSRPSQNKKRKGGQSRRGKKYVTA